MSQPTATSGPSRRGHLAILGCACLLALATCGPSLSADLTGDTAPTSSTDAAGAAAAPGLPTLPDSEPVDGSGRPVDQSAERNPSGRGDPAEAAADPGDDGAGDEPAGIETQQPTIRLTGNQVIADPRSAALEVDGVRSATAIRVGQLPIATSDGATTVETASVDPEQFRVFTPQVTADATEVWERIDEGDIAVTHDTGQQLGVELGERLPAGGGDGGHVRIGAFASNGIPPVADAIISHSAAEELGFGGDLEILVSLNDGVDGNLVARLLTEATGLEAEPIVPPETQQADQEQTGQQASSVPARSQQIEPFRYQSIGDGMIRIDPSWVRRNIVSANVPVLPGAVRCHRAMIPQLRAALQEVAERGLAEIIRPGDYGGCWTPRHIMFNPQRNLSMHAWGLAIDFNVSTNGYGAQPQLDPRIVEIFQKWGFEWGGNWSTPDGMHFELRTLMDVPG